MAEKGKPGGFRTNLESNAVSGFKSGQKDDKTFTGESEAAKLDFINRNEKQRKKKHTHTRAADGTDSASVDAETDSYSDKAKRSENTSFNGKDGKDEAIYGGNVKKESSKEKTSGKIAGSAGGDGGRADSKASGADTSRYKADYKSNSGTFKRSDSSGSAGSGAKSAFSEGASDTKRFFSDAYGDTKKAVDATSPHGSSSTDNSSNSGGGVKGENGQSAQAVFGGAGKDIKDTKKDASKRSKRAFSTTTNSIRASKRFTEGAGRTIKAFIPKQEQSENMGEGAGNDTASGATRAVEGAFRGVKVAVETTIKAIVAIINFIVTLVTGGFAAAFAGCLPIAIIIGIVLILIVVIITVLISVLTTLISFIAGAFFAAETVTGSDMYQYAYECAVAFQEEYEAEAADADKTSLYIDGTFVTIPEDGYELEIDYTSVFFIYLAKYETATYADEYLNLTEDSAESCLDRLTEGTSENKDNFDEIFEDFCGYYTTRDGTLRLDTYTLLGYADYYEPIAYDYDLFTNNLICLWDAYEVSGEYATALGVESAETVTVTVPYIEFVETEVESEEESAEETTEEETETEVETESETTTEAEATSEVETEAEETEEETTTSGSGHTGGGSSFTQATIG